MSSASPDLTTTVLHPWHMANGGKMVSFGGYDMPVQYAHGIVQEHLATRRTAGLFDVSHMGRFRVSGPQAEAFLMQVLTNDASKLLANESQYTFIANERGSAVDDAYLYKHDADDFLLVVNASNRTKDWQWLVDKTLGDMALTDVSEEMAMIALQGPQSADYLAAIVGADALPQDKRNQLSRTHFAGAPLLIARTGYTGEAVCFELFPGRQQTIALWEQLIALGAAPVGLGARDSLRLQASLPLYGHELGVDTAGEEIPIFAVSLARFGVRRIGTNFMGGEALERQRAVTERIRSGESLSAEEKATLPARIHPIAVLEGRRPLRAGHKVFHGEQRIGVVTSGTVVPHIKEDGHTLRPIGLAMVDSELRYQTEPPIGLRIEDDRGKSSTAVLTRRNL